jgi:hypothetical protein
MITERKEDIIWVEAESYIEKLLEKYLRAKLGDRIGEVENGELYSQTGRDGTTDSEEIGNIVRLPPSV